MCDRVLYIIAIYLTLRVIAVVTYIIGRLIVAIVEWIEDIKWELEFRRREKK